MILINRLMSGFFTLEPAQFDVRQAGVQLPQMVDDRMHPQAEELHRGFATLEFPFLLAQGCLLYTSPSPRD